jgi:hypothetical protein
MKLLEGWMFESDYASGLKGHILMSTDCKK